jgi:hypothetical protein
MTMTGIQWQLLTTAPNVPSAHALVSSLSAHGVVSKIVSDTSLLGEFQVCRVFIDAAQVHRAQWLLAQNDFSDEELSFLATGSLAPAEPGE